MNKNIYHKLGSEFRKYLWVFIIIGMTFYFWPQDHFKNCLNDFRNILKGKYNDKEDRQGAILLCEQIKKSNPDLFREYKGKIFTKTTLFVPRQNENWFKNNKDDYKVFYWEEVFVFIICGLLISGFFGVVLSLPHWIAFSIGYPFAFIIIIKKKHKDINNDVKEYLKLINKKK